MGFQTANMPRPQSENRPSMPVVPRWRLEGQERGPAIPVPPEGNEPARPVPPIFAKHEAAKRIRAEYAEMAGLSIAEFCGSRGDPKTVELRQEAMACIRTRLGWSTPRIGRFFGGRDHSTVLHAIKRVRAMQEAAEREVFLAAVAVVVEPYWLLGLNTADIASHQLVVMNEVLTEAEIANGLARLRVRAIEASKKG